ncbi:MAG: NYN domain-containing protein [Acidobacteria bacterium]|nr:NYN domain-containing protein [Acidobacteriota bacterium]
MDRVAVFVDAGYLFAQGSVALAGQKLPRGRLVLDHEKAIDALADFAVRVSGVDLLRVYWYDGTSTGPSSQHLTLAHLARVKVRLGFVNSVGEQKGVDSLIVTDMIALARNHAMSEAVLLSGDEDLRVGVQQAQEFGVRVHLLGIRPSRGSQSLFLLQEADSTHEWSPDDLTPFLSCKPDIAVVSAAPLPAAAPAPLEPMLVPDPLNDVASALATEIPTTELEALTESIRQSGQIPKEFDGRLLAEGGRALKVRLDPAQKKEARNAFLKACEQRLAQAQQTAGGPD